MTPWPASPAAERNKQPILEALRQVLPARGRALEIASGTGQHVAWLGAGLPGWQWQPSEASSAALPSIAAHVQQAGIGNVHPPCLLDVMDVPWPSDDGTLARQFANPFDAIFCANLLHITDWSVCNALMLGASRHLAQGGLLLIYGPFLEDEVPTAPSNLAFDDSLRRQNPAWGIRHRTAVERCAQQAGLQAQRRVAMPAHNLLLVFVLNPASAGADSPNSRH
ncbi:MAG: class I SAM-dependent methyltransferase [Hydrogenophaga sp.]|nr:class I SAM-dependent methyltransferase [Hydrogenophaga sp.]